MVAAAGINSALRHYILPDAQLPADMARRYYRLKPADADSTFTYIPVRTMPLASAAAGLSSRYPNPALAAWPRSWARLCEQNGCSYQPYLLPDS